MRQLHSSVMTTGGVTVPNQLNQRGVANKTIRREPTILRELGEAVLGDRWPSRQAWAAILERDLDAHTGDGPVEWTTGALLLANSGCDRIVGDRQHNYSLYSEEVDSAHRVRDGLQVEVRIVRAHPPPFRRLETNRSAESARDDQSSPALRALASDALRTHVRHSGAARDCPSGTSPGTSSGDPSIADMPRGGHSWQALATE